MIVFICSNVEFRNFWYMINVQSNKVITKRDLFWIFIFDQFNSAILDFKIWTSSFLGISVSSLVSMTRSLTIPFWSSDSPMMTANGMPVSSQYWSWFNILGFFLYDCSVWNKNIYVVLSGTWMMQNILKIDLSNISSMDQIYFQRVDIFDLDFVTVAPRLAADVPLKVSRVPAAGRRISPDRIVVRTGSQRWNLLSWSRGRWSRRLGTRCGEDWRSFPLESGLLSEVKRV